MYTGENFKKIIEPYSFSHFHNGAPCKPKEFKIIDFPEPETGRKAIPDDPIIHHIICLLCGKDLTFEKGESKIYLGRKPNFKIKI
jgi:hypothetical protein